MKIVLLDRGSIGADTPIEVLFPLGEVICYDTTSENEVGERVKDADVIIINKVKVTRAVIDSAKSLKLICVFATGFDNIDVSYARKKGIAVCNVPAYSTDSVALCTVATVSALATRLFQYASYVKSGGYTESGVANKLTPVYHEIKGKTWGIIGLGNIGTAVAAVANALGASVIVNKRHATDAFNCVDIDTLCKQSDIITIHCPLNESTKHLINRQRISLMKKDVIIVNEARGLVVDECAIRDAIINKKIGAFGSDVYSEEPFSRTHPFYEIRDFDNVLLTPHFAWGAYEARERCINIVKSNIEACFSGKIQNRVDLQ